MNMALGATGETLNLKSTSDSPDFNLSMTRPTTTGTTTNHPMTPPLLHQTNSLTNLEQKINRAKKRIQEEQRRRDANVDDYLKTAATAPRNQLPQVKAVFEKRNTKAATHIAALQRKLEKYQRELETIGAEIDTSPNHRSKLEPNTSTGSPKIGAEGYLGSEASGSSNASSNKASKNRLQNVSQGIKSVSGNLKDGITGISGTVIGKPKEIASYLLKHKFGSADNIPVQVKESEGRYHCSANIPAGGDGLHNVSAPVHSHQNTLGMEGGMGDNDILGGHNDSECNSVSAKSSSLGRDAKPPSGNVVTHSEFMMLLQQIQDMKDELVTLREDYETFKSQVTQDSALIYQGLQEEKFRAERLEEQVNDLTELHQAETGNLKQALADAEEKLSYQSEERLRDLAEMLDACQTKISRLEQQQQQLVTIEGIENSTARALAVKVVNIGLTMLQLILLLVATVASTLAPFIGSRIRFFGSILLGLIIFLAHRKWPHAHEMVIDVWTDFLNKL